MTTNKIIAVGLVASCLVLLGFNYVDKLQTGRTEEYALIRYYGGIIERNVNGKTEGIKLEGEKVDGLPGKNTSSALMRELNKVNEQGYELVNVSVTGVSQAYTEVYLFKKKK